MRCSQCGRKTYDAQKYGRTCNMLHPNGELCDGIFVSAVEAGLPPAELPADCPLVAELMKPPLGQGE